MNTILSKKITCGDDVVTFIKCLESNNKLFHFEDDPRDVLNESLQCIFTEEECVLIDERVEEICELELLEFSFDYILVKYYNNLFKW